MVLLVVKENIVLILITLAVVLTMKSIFCRAKSAASNAKVASKGLD